MKINNNSIQGIYLYNEDYEFELGDFVIYDSSIYICTPKTDQKKFPISPDKDLLNFSLYLSTEKVSIEELMDLYDNGIDNTKLNDKLVTSDVLSKFLKKISFGLNSEGIIDKEVFNNYVSPSLGEFSNNKNSEILDILIQEQKPEYNNLTIKVSRDLVSSLIQEKPVDVDDLDFKSVILKHYTYFEYSDIDPLTGEKTMYRIQEIIDHVYGVCLYRYAKLSEVSDKRGLSPWKISCPNVDYVKQLSTALKNLSSEKKANTELFNFKEISFRSPNSQSQGNTYDYVLNESGENLYEKIVTITISEITDGNIIPRNYSMTVKYRDSSSYRFPNNTVISFSRNVLKILNNSSDGKTEIRLVNIYTRNYVK